MKEGYKGECKEVVFGSSNEVDLNETLNSFCLLCKLFLIKEGLKVKLKHDSKKFKEVLEDIRKDEGVTDV